MSVNLSIAGTVYPFPEQNDCAGYGECVTDAVVAIVDALETVVGPNDISPQVACVANTQSSAANVGTGSSLLRFSTTAVRSFNVLYDVRRVGCTTVVETGEMKGVYSGSAWTFGYEHEGCAGMVFSITAAGQVQYISTTLTGQTSGKVHYRASTVAQ